MDKIKYLITRNYYLWVASVVLIAIPSFLICIIVGALMEMTEAAFYALLRQRNEFSNSKPDLSRKNYESKKLRFNLDA